MNTWRQALFALAIAGWVLPVMAVSPQPQEFLARGDWLEQVFGAAREPEARTNSRTLLPFSFEYRGGHGIDQLSRWQGAVRESRLDASRLQREMTYRDPVSSLEVRIEVVEFADFPAVEWVIHFKNRGSANTPILADIQALNALLPVPETAQPILHWSKGAVASFDDFAPQETVLKPNSTFRLEAQDGRSSGQVLPFFNLAGADAGVIIAVGWTGAWAVEFSRDQGSRVVGKAGLARTHLVLFPGEEIRTPRIGLLFYAGDRWRGQNLWRQFVLAHHRPSAGGQPLVAPITCGNWGATRAEVHLDNIQKIIRHQLPIEYYWIDCDWFSDGGWPGWKAGADRYPDGLRPIADALHHSGRKFLLWFEPERVYKQSRLVRAHPEWLLTSPMEDPNNQGLYDLGNPAARRHLTDLICQRVKEYGLDCYRQDFNECPRSFWEVADAAAPNRQGMTEIKHIQGLYAFWDELLARNPGLIIDNCCGGGRRVDLETLGRGTPFWRTDGPRDPIAHQCHSYGLLAWVPLSATSQDRAGDDYEFRSSMCSGLCLNWWVSGDRPAERIRADFPFAWAKATLDQYLTFRQFYYGDYYPLTPYSQSKAAWIAYQLDRADLGKGMVVVLRRPETASPTIRLALHGLDKKSRYRVMDLDTKAHTSQAGEQLLQDGLAVSLPARPASALFIYERE